jgi:hypothetical protein
MIQLQLGHWMSKLHSFLHLLTFPSRLYASMLLISFKKKIKKKIFDHFFTKSQSHTFVGALILLCHKS